MESTEVTKLKQLLAELDRLCADARKTREKIEEVTRQGPIWPERRHFFRPLGETSEPHDLATLPDRERNN